MRKLIYIVIIVMILNGCITISISRFAEINDKKLSKLSIGMTKKQVLKIMGDKPKMVKCETPEAILFGPRYRDIDNPYDTRILHGEDKTIEVIYYLTYTKNNHCYGPHYLTPLVFENGTLIGWGKDFLIKKIDEYNIRKYHEHLLH